MMLAIVLVVIAIGCIALYGTARHRDVQRRATAAFALFWEPASSPGGAWSSNAPSSVVPMSGSPHPPSGVMPPAQAKRKSPGRASQCAAYPGRGSVSKLFASATLLALAVPPASATADQAPVPGHFILARTHDDALAIWDSTPEIAAIVNGKLSDLDARSRLERDALRVLAAVTPEVASNAKTISVRVIYSKTGEVSPVYGTPTFADVERFATLTMKAQDAASDRDKWKELGDGAPPAWVRFDVVGDLPPR